MDATPTLDAEVIVPDDEQAKAAASPLRRIPTIPEELTGAPAIAIWLNEATKLVFSRTLKEATWPVFLGNGRSLLDGVSKSVKLELLEIKKYPSGDVLLRYARR